MLSRKTVASFAVGLMLFVGAVNAKAGSTDLATNPLDQISNFAAQARAAGGSAPSTASLATAPLAKFSANGRINETIGAGGCLNNPLTATCTSSNCDFLTMSGQVNATGIGKSNLDACFTLILSSFSGLCYNGLGIGSLTAANGNKVNIAFGGNFCLADETLSTITLFYNSNWSYVVEGGTGPFATETGNGNITASTIIVNPPSSLPYSATGQFTMTGGLSKN